MEFSLGNSGAHALLLIHPSQEGCASPFYRDTPCTTIYWRISCKHLTFSMKTVYKTNLSPKSILHENGLPNKLFTKKASPRIRSTKQAFHKKNGLQNKPFTKNHFPRKRSTKQAFHQKNISKKTVYKTNLPQKKTQENGL